MTVAEYAEAILWSAASRNGVDDVLLDRPDAMEYARAWDAFHMALAAGMKAVREGGGIRYRIPPGSWLLRARETRGELTVRSLHLCRSGDLAKARAKRATLGELRSVPQLFEIIDPTGRLWARCHYNLGAARLRWEMAE